jgi:hypothetical protein
MSSLTLRYSKLIKTDIATNPITLADSGFLGHRVQCKISVSDLNRFFSWTRSPGEVKPIGHFTSFEDISGYSFANILNNTFSNYFTDIDGVTNGLHFSSAILDANPDPNIRQNNSISANDIVLAYILYKLYGSTSSPTRNIIFNIQNTYNILPNDILINAIKVSMLNEESLSANGAINDMFQKLLAEDPTRFFDAAGKQVPGLFEINNTEAVRGSWNFIENDIIELNVQFTFSNSVTIDSVSEDSNSIHSTIFIPVGTQFKIRLQLVATDSPTSATKIQQEKDTAINAEVVRKKAAQEKAAENAANALSDANQAISAAQKQTDAENSKYQATLIRNSQQREAVLVAEVALADSQASLALAKQSGIQENIQQQNAAMLRAQAVLENQKAIADLLSAELQKFSTSLIIATTNLNTMQSSKSELASVISKINLDASKKELDTAEAAAAALESTIQSSEAASNPFTQTLLAQQDYILNPQNLSIILSKANSATQQRKAAFDTAIQKFGNQEHQLSIYNSAIYNLNFAIATGSNISQIQHLQGIVMGASNLLFQAILTSSNAESTLAGCYNSEYLYIQQSALASSNAASLSETIASANTNDARKTFNMTKNAYIYASSINTGAAAAVVEAQTILNRRIQNGAIMSEVQTRTKALLDANNAYTAATSTMNASLVAFRNASNAYNEASNLANESKKNISSVIESNMLSIHQYETSLRTSSEYQANVVSNAKINNLNIQVNTELNRLHTANLNVAKAEASLNLLKLNNASIREITTANDTLTQALLIQKTTQTKYNILTLNAANKQVQLLESDATSYFNASITQPQLAIDNIIYYSTLIQYSTQIPSSFSTETSSSSKLTLWKSHLNKYEKIASNAFHIFNKDLVRYSTFIIGNPSISTSLGSLSNYFIANSNSSHIIYQANSISTLLTAIDPIPSQLQERYNIYSSQSNDALVNTATSYNTYLANSLLAQSFSYTSSIGHDILNSAAHFQLSQISSATMNTRVNLYLSSLQNFNTVQLDYITVSTATFLSGQELQNASLTNTPSAQLILFRDKYAKSSADLSILARKLNQSSNALAKIKQTIDTESDASNIISTATGLQLSYLSIAENNDLVNQANTLYCKYVELQNLLTVVNLSTNAVLDEISVKLANSANLSTIIPYQKKLSEIQNSTISLHYDLENLYITLSSLTSRVNPNSLFVSSINSGSNDIYIASVNASINESAQFLETAQIEQSAASNAFFEANANLTIISTQFSIQLQEGVSFNELIPLTSSFRSASINLENKQRILTQTSAALAQSLSNYNNVSQRNQSFQTTLTNLSTLLESQSFQQSSIIAATSNVLTASLTNTYMGMLHYSTLVQLDYAHYQNILVRYNTQPENADVNIVKIALAYNKYMADQQKELAYTTAYTNFLGLANINPQSRSILSAVALNQTTLIQSAKANDLYKNLQEANATVFRLHNEFITAQSLYTIANSELQIATANVSPQEIIESKFSTLVSAGNYLNKVQIQYNIAQTSAQTAKSYVNVNANSQSILETAATQYITQANLAQANVLVSKYKEAVENEGITYSELQTAQAALASAQELFNSVITSGADITVIQKARDAQYAAAKAVTNASFIQKNAMAAMNQALQNANLDQIAQSLIITARLTNENTTAGGAVNTAKHKYHAFSTILSKESENLTLAEQKNNSARSTLQSAVQSGMTSEEITELMSLASLANASFYSAEVSYTKALKDFNEGATLVSSLTQTFSTTSGTLLLNNNNNTLLYNGFVYNQTYDKYVLKPSFLPATVISGLPFQLYTITVDPIDLGVYNPSTSYVLGNLVYFPDSDGAQYMCAVSRDPRGV